MDDTTNPGALAGLKQRRRPVGVGRFRGVIGGILQNSGTVHDCIDPDQMGGPSLGTNRPR